MPAALIAVEAVKTFAGVSGQAKKEAGKISIEYFQFDFLNLGIKLFLWFSIAIVIDKIHFVITGSAVNVVATIVNAFGYNLPTAQNEPNFFKKLFNEGYFGLKYWDIIKILAVVLVLIEFLKWYENEKRMAELNGTKAAPNYFTVGIFAIIMALLMAFTVPDIIQKLKMRMPAGGN